MPSWKMAGFCRCVWKIESVNGSAIFGSRNFGQKGEESECRRPKVHFSIERDLTRDLSVSL